MGEVTDGWSWLMDEMMTDGRIDRWWLMDDWLMDEVIDGRIDWWMSWLMEELLMD